MGEKPYNELMLERIVLGEIEIPEAMKRDELVLKRIEELRESNDEILRRYPARTMVGSIEDRIAGDRISDAGVPADPGRRESPISVFPTRRSVALLAAAVVLVIAGLVPALLVRSGNGDAGPIRIKGASEASIRIYRQAGNEAEELGERSIVKENDLLQIAYLSGGKPFGVILSIDGRGVVTVHYPYESAMSGALEPGGEVALDYAYRLDDAPAFERFFFVTSDRQFAVSRVFDAAQSLAGASSGGARGNLELPNHIDQYSLTLTKESSR